MMASINNRSHKWERVMMDKAKLVFILSCGRSGSTLLELLLNTQPNVWTVGELQVLPWLLADRSPCGCGEPVASCAFWKPILGRVSLRGSVSRLDAFRETRLGGRAIRPSHLAQIALDWHSATWSRFAEDYGETSAELLRQVRDAAQTRRGNEVDWLVDASKDPYRLACLRSSERFDLRVIHLLKDPRAFAYSMLRSEPAMRRRRMARFAVRWVFQNGLFEMLCRTRFAPASTYRLRYEDLARRPEAVMMALAHWLGFPLDEEAIGDYRSRENHGLSGNPMRWKKGGIRLDEAWRRELPAGYATAVWTLTASLARHFGYRA